MKLVLHCAARLALAAVLCLASFVLCAADKVQTRVSVTSQPDGAVVLVDGQKRGVAPLVLFDVAPGPHHLKCRKPGFIDQDLFFNTVEEPIIDLNAELAEEKGILLLRTDPAECNVTIDGVSAGRTPLLVTHLAARGTYTVRLQKAGYLDQTLSVKFNGRTPLVREEKLVLASGTLDLVSEPAGAEVTVNGIVRGVTPLVVTEVPKGHASVKFHLDGYEDVVRGNLAINAGDRQTLSVVLVGQPGTLHLVSNPEGARFYVNDEARGKGPLSIPGLKPGDYVVRAEMDGYGPVTKTISIDNGESVREEFALPNIMGRIEVRTDPVDAQVLLDGRLIGSTKAQSEKAEFSDVLAIENVLEGEHTLIVRKPGYAESVRHPIVESSKTLQTKVRLKRVFVPDVEIVTARGTYRGMLVSNSPDSVVVEVSLGISRTFTREEIRKINFLTQEK